jgi:TonB family protein
VADRLVGADGDAHGMRVLKSLGLGLDDKAIQAARKWRFKPAMKGGQAVDAAARFEVNFRMLLERAFS